MIGSGVFLLPSALASYGAVSLLGWLFTVGGAFMLALTFSRLSRLVRSAGGPYAYSREGLGDTTAFFVAWGYWVSVCAGNAAIAVAMVGYLGVFWPALSDTGTAAATAAFVSVWFLTWINHRGLRTAASFQLITTILKLFPLLVVGFLGIWWIQADYFTPFNRSDEPLFAAVNSTASLTLWALLGLESSTIPSDRVRNPERTIPIATWWGTVVTAVVYVAGSIAVLGLVPPEVLTSSSAPFADAAGLLWGRWAEILVGFGAVISCLGALNGWILLQGQVPYVAAQDGLFPKFFGTLSKRRTPTAALVFSSLLISFLLWMNYSASLVDQFTFVILLSTLTVLLPYSASALAAVILSRRAADIQRWRAISYNAVFILALLYSIWAIVGIGAKVIGLGFLLLLAGAPIYIYLKSGKKRQS
jgi:APA family basic amino acid/polyamine antiporter